jgi:hypothetical protein
MQLTGQNEGDVNLWGLVASGAERAALHVAAENTPGVRVVTGGKGTLEEGRRNRIRSNDQAPEETSPVSDPIPIICG